MDGRFIIIPENGMVLCQQGLGQCAENQDSWFIAQQWLETIDSVDMIKPKLYLLA